MNNAIRNYYQRHPLTFLYDFALKSSNVCMLLTLMLGNIVAMHMQHSILHTPCLRLKSMYLCILCYPQVWNSVNIIITKRSSGCCIQVYCWKCFLLYHCLRWDRLFELHSIDVGTRLTITIVKVHFSIIFTLLLHIAFTWKRAFVTSLFQFYWQLTLLLLSEIAIVIGIISKYWFSTFTVINPIV